MMTRHQEIRLQCSGKKPESSVILISSSPKGRVSPDLSSSSFSPTDDVLKPAERCEELVPQR